MIRSQTEVIATARGADWLLPAPGRVSLPTLRVVDVRRPRDAVLLLPRDCEFLQTQNAEPRPRKFWPVVLARRRATLRFQQRSAFHFRLALVLLHEPRRALLPERVAVLRLLR